MDLKIDVDKLADETFEQIIEKYKAEINDGLNKISQGDNSESPIHVLIDATRKHNERFTTLLIEKVVDELTTSFKID